MDFQFRLHNRVLFFLNDNSSVLTRRPTPFLLSPELLKIKTSPYFYPIPVSSGIYVSLPYFL